MLKGRVSGLFVAGVCAALAFTVGNVSASKGAWEEYDKLIKSSEAIAALGPTLFGDQSNLQNGGLSFSVTDVSLKGNNGLPVAITRTFKTKTSGGAMKGTLPGSNLMDGAMGDWEIDLPFVGGVFAQSTGWINSAAGKAAQRCSVANTFEATPKSLTVGTSSFDGNNYWHGTRINIPGAGSQAMLVVNAASHRPIGSNAYWTTSAFTSVSCLSSVQNATGEGFIATTADGTRYWFDWMAMAYEQELTQQRTNGYDHLPRGAYGLYATRVEDRFGNWVTYSYSNAANAPVRLSQISSSDGRLITVTHNAAGFVSSVVAHGRTWSYSYSADTSGSLSSVVLPDSSRWSINLATLQNMRIRYYQGEPGEAWRNCGNPGEVAPLTYVGTVTHPSGAVGEFTLDIQRFGRSGVTYAQNCAFGKVNDVNDDSEWYPTAWDSYALKSKKVSGPGLTPATWNYAYSQGNGTEVFGPSDYARYTYGNTFRHDEGKLLRVERGSGPAGILTSTAYTYELAQSGMPYPTPIGVSPQIRSDDFGDEYLRPQKTTTTVQQGVTFSSLVNSFDPFARPLSIGKWSSLGHGKTDNTEYYDDKSKWVLGQISRQYNANTGYAMSQVDYWPATALPQRTWAFGKAQQYMVYNADGTLASVTDGRNETTLLSNWKRGVPQRIQHPDGTGESAVVNDSGWITAVADENNFWTGYGYDVMGRMASIVHPTGDSVAFSNTTMTFAVSNSPVYGLPAGHWRQTVMTGNARTVIMFDAMWRPVVKETYDAANLAGTIAQTVTRYDVAGRPTFGSYPQRNLDPAVYNTWADSAQAPNALGVHTTYDALDRPIRAEQDSELGRLVSHTQYLSGFMTRAVNPKGLGTVTSYQVYDQPDTSLPVGITMADGMAATEIRRDPHLSRVDYITRRNSDGSLASTRQYFYDSHQQLCKTIEPETGSTVMAYDKANNLEWSAAGLNLPAHSCDHGAAFASGRAVQRDYSSRNRLIGLRFPDGRGNQTLTYTPDGLPERIVTSNDGLNQTTVENHYQYNKRRMLVRERSVQPGWYDWAIAYGYDANGSLASQNYPTGLNVDYAPNALGQPTRAGSWATNVSYYPNGAIQQFIYGNGVAHTLYQNARQLPLRSIDTGVVDFETGFDANGNVDRIDDFALGLNYSRWMQYDGMDRLTGAGSVMFGGDHWHRYTYDALDNMTSSKLAGVKEHNYEYDASTKRLSMVRNNAGAATMALEYDVQGNLRVKNGQNYSFDYGNRLRDVTGKEYYRYDGHGRRVLAWVPNQGSILSQYSQSGQVMYQHDERKTTTSEHIYLGGSLLATRESNWALGQLKTKYQHTDALGSPVAVTNEVGQVIDRTQYEPYGAAIGKVAYGVGYTGHVSDAATGLTYMQQRYYDPTLGRFLSVDPVTANSNTGGNFNRYWYANNNPYKFTDPDGRMVGDPFGGIEGGDRPGRQKLRECNNGNTCYGGDGTVPDAPKTQDSNHSTKPTGSGPDLFSNGNIFDVGALAHDVGVPLLNSPQGGALAAGFKFLGVPIGAAFNWSRAGHIFRSAAGHINPATSASRARFAQLFRAVSSNPNYLRADAVQAGIITQQAANAGASAYTFTTRSGQQVWVTVRNDEIMNAGVNAVGAAR